MVGASIADGDVCVCVYVVETEWDESVLYDLETEVADGGIIYNEAERRFLSGGCLSQVKKVPQVCIYMH